MTSVRRSLVLEILYHWWKQTQRSGLAKTACYITCLAKSPGICLSNWPFHVRGSFEQPTTLFRIIGFRLLELQMGRSFFIILGLKKIQETSTTSLVMPLLSRLKFLTQTVSQDSRSNFRSSNIMKKLLLLWISRLMKVQVRPNSCLVKSISQYKCHVKLHNGFSLSLFTWELQKEAFKPL